MTDPTPPSSNNQRIIIAVLVGVILIALGVIAGIWVNRGGLGAADSTTTTTVPAPTTTALPPTTTTAPSPSTTTVPDPGNQVVIPVAEDTMIDADDPNEVMGAQDEIVLKQEGADIERGLLRFEVEGIPEGEPISSATLQLIQLDDTDQGGIVSLVGGPWTEEETTWATAPPLGDEIASLPADAPDGLVEIDVTSAVTGNGTFDFYLSTIFEESVDYGTKEGGEGANLVVVWGETVESDTVLVGAADIASCESDGDEATAALIAQFAEAAEDLVVITAGDNAYEEGTLQQFNDCYEPSWGQFKDITRPAVGAREYRTDGAAGYFAYFGSAAGDASEGYYSYDAGGWHIVVLNSNCEQVGGCEAGSPQEVWLREDLDSFSTSCTLAYWHHPLFSSGGGEPQVDDLYRALYESGAELVINGDRHFYERFEPQNPDGELNDEGIRQFIVGTGGRSLQEIGATAANSAARFNGGFGVLALTLMPGAYEWDFLTVPGVEFTDSGSDNCH